MRKQCGEGSTEPRRQFVAFAKRDIADGFQSGAAQSPRDRLVSAEGSNRQIGNSRGLLAASNDFAGETARQRARADRGSGNGSADVKTLAGQRGGQRAQQRRLTAE